MIIKMHIFIQLTVFDGFSLRYIYMENPVVNQEDITTYEMPSKERIVILLATWAMTFGIMCVSNYRYRKVDICIVTKL